MKILVVTLSNLGDVVLTLPVFQALAKKYPEATLDVIAGKSGAMVFEGDRRIRRLTVYHKKSSWSEKIKLLGSVRAEKYDLIIDLRRSLIGLLGGAEKRNSYLSVSSKKTKRVYRHLLALSGICEVEPKLFLSGSFLKPLAPTSRFAAFLERQGGEKIILASPGSKADIKKWPAAHFACVLDRLSLENNCRIGLVGDAPDRADADKVIGLMVAPAQNFCGETTFSELTSLIQGADLVITNDSAPLHVADSLNVPVLGLFGPTDPRKYGPKGPLSAVAQHLTFCSPCEKAQCRYGHECLIALSPEEVYKKATLLLNDRNEKHDLKILAIRLDRIGDVVLSFPALEALRRCFPNAWIAAMTRPETASLMERCSAVDEVIPYFYGRGGRHANLLGYGRFLKEIRKRQFNAAIVLHPSTRSHLLPFLAGIPRRVGFGSVLPALLTVSVDDVRHQGKKHEMESTLDVVRAFGAKESVPPPHLSLYPDDIAKINSLLSNNGAPWVAIHAGASCPSKRWPKEKFLELAQRLNELRLANIVIVGGSGEMQDATYLKERLGEQSLNVAGSLSLTELAAVLKKVKLLISNDSGPVHIAAAVGTPTLTIFGRNRAGLNHERWRAQGRGHEIVHKNVGCQVCLAHECPIGFECLEAVEVDEVFGRAKGMLSL